jgi:competence protein ComEA
VSDQLQASIERLRAARTEVRNRPEPEPKDEFELEPPISRKLDGVAEDDWLSASNGRIPGIESVASSEPRFRLRVRTAFVGAFSLLALAGGVVSVMVISSDPEPIVVSSIPAEPTHSSAIGPVGEHGAPTLPVTGEIFVHIAGAVNNPGLVQLPYGSRVAQAIELAGGAAEGADLSAINLARILEDGEQIKVPIVGQVFFEDSPPEPPPVDLANSRDHEGKVNLNHASPTLLQELPGIGPALAERIIAFREQMGGFHAIEQLLEVSGIGPAVFGDVHAQVST